MEDFIIDSRFLRNIADTSYAAGGEIQNVSRNDINLTNRAAYLILLDQTLVYASRHIPYFRSLFESIHFKCSDFKTIRDLQRLPIMDREVLNGNKTALISDSSEIVSIRCTSGTTSLYRVPVFVSAAEVEACDLARQINENVSSEKAAHAGETPLVLRLIPAMRRIISPSPSVSGGRTRAPITLTAMIDIDFPKYATRYDYFDSAIRMLYERYPIPGTSEFVSIIHATPPWLMKLVTTEMLDRRLDPQDTHVRTIVCSGSLLTQSLRASLQQAWNATICSTFSFTESNGCGVECRLYPQRYHFDKFLYIEVIDLTTSKAVAHGQEGVVLITTLYPFHQGQLLIRYKLGDIGVLHEDECQCGFIGQTLEFRGRISHSLDLTDTLPEDCRKRFVGSADILNVIDDVIGIDPRTRFKVTRSDEGSKVIATVHIEVPIVVPEGTSRLRKQIVSRLEDMHSEWQGVLGSRLAFDVQLYNRGELGGEFVGTP